MATLTVEPQGVGWISSVPVSVERGGSTTRVRVRIKIFHGDRMFRIKRKVSWGIIGINMVQVGMRNVGQGHGLLGNPLARLSGEWLILRFLNFYYLLQVVLMGFLWWQCVHSLGCWGRRVFMGFLIGILGLELIFFIFFSDTIFVIVVVLGSCCLNSGVIDSGGVVIVVGGVGNLGTLVGGGVGGGVGGFHGVGGVHRLCHRRGRVNDESVP